MAGFEKTAKTPHAGRFRPPCRGPRRRSRLGLLTALDTARRPSPPHPQRGPSTPVFSVCPETDARASTTWRLQPPSASLVLWRKPRNPPSVAVCALDPGVDTTAAARSELRSRLPFTVVHRTVHRPQHLTAAPRRHSTPVYLQSKNQAHDHTARLTIHSSQAG